MIRPRLSAALTSSALLVSLSILAAFPPKAAAQLPIFGGSYIITNTDSTGAFASRGVITLHADRTLSVIDSGQGGPFHFTSQLGTWGANGKGAVVGRTIDFDFPPSADVARLDWTFQFGSNQTISGTVTVTTFPLTANPLDGGGTVIGTFTFTGYHVTLP